MKRSERLTGRWRERRREGERWHTHHHIHTKREIKGREQESPQKANLQKDERRRLRSSWSPGGRWRRWPAISADSASSHPGPSRLRSSSPAARRPPELPVCFQGWPRPWTAPPETWARGTERNTCEKDINNSPWITLISISKMQDETDNTRHTTHSLFQGILQASDLDSLQFIKNKK